MAVASRAPATHAVSFRYVSVKDTSAAVYRRRRRTFNRKAGARPARTVLLSLTRRGQRYSYLERHAMERPHQLADGVSFVIPAYDEEAGIGSVLTDLERVIKTEGLDAEVLVVDDGSRDATAAVAASHGARVIPMNVGYGAALKRGIEAARHSRLVITDADGSYPLEVVGRLVRDLERFDLVIARRTGGT
ncbi:MAG: hypothetical protein DMD91_19850 [Candidatus Rokuibacteriota bacterium]|nr:MAG: hypothetical protein DMD91_19850 [Candidatus Rokubacteria bacterium]